jgi:hypothetical protein
MLTFGAQQDSLSGGACTAPFRQDPPLVQRKGKRNGAWNEDSMGSRLVPPPLPKYVSTSATGIAAMRPAGVKQSDDVRDHFATAATLGNLAYVVSPPHPPRRPALPCARICLQPHFLCSRRAPALAHKCLHRSPAADGSAFKLQRGRPRPNSPSFVDHMLGSNVLFGTSEDEVAQGTGMHKGHGGLKFSDHRTDDHMLMGTAPIIGKSSISSLAFGEIELDEIAVATGMKHALKHAAHRDDDHFRGGVAALIGHSSISNLKTDTRDEIAVATGMHTAHGGLSGAAHRSDDHFLSGEEVVGHSDRSKLAVDMRDEVAVATGYHTTHGGEAHIGEVSYEHAEANPAYAYAKN